MEKPVIFPADGNTAFGRPPALTIIFAALTAALWLVPHPVAAQTDEDRGSVAMPLSTLSQVEASGYSSLSSDELDETRGTMKFRGSIDLTAEDNGHKRKHEHLQFNRKLKPGEHYSVSRKLTGRNSQSSSTVRVSRSRDGSTITSSSSSHSSSGLP
ncbi:hypothetical protein GGE65_000753 [Skermanella aerolata]|uniref:hypothetical protein n=1 Tax=Skermanella aerolata TaxID=393310 RepID=UPI003D1C84D3